MRSVNFKPALAKSALAASVLLLASTASVGQQVVNLAAGPATATMPDGAAVPMWGLSCGAITGTAGVGGTQTCTPLNSAATTAAIWSPVVITVPTGQDLYIQLTNNLTFVAGAGSNNIPTSLVILGQLGGGLGTLGTVVGDASTACTAGTTCTASPDHTNAQPLTWPIAGDAPGAPVTGVGTPPVQGPRVQSLGTEVVVGTPQTLCWGVCGDLTGTHPALRPGTYLIQSGTHASIQGAMGLYGILVVTSAPAGGAMGTAYPAAGTAAAVTYSAEVPLLFSEIDPIQNTAVAQAVITAGFKETNVWSGLYGGCGNQFNANGSPNSGATASATPYGTCYPPAVNYTPLYYTINGRAFDKTNPSASLYATTPAAGATSVLVRLVNAGLRMHVPSIVGAQTGAAAAAGMSLIAEDGNVLPGVQRIQSEVFMAAGKTYDVMVNAPAGTSALPIFDRQLSLSGNSIGRDSGMLAYIGANAAVGATAVPVAAVAAAAVADSYSLVAGQTLVVSDPGKGVLANDTNVYGVKLISGATACNATSSNAPCVTLNADGTFAFVPGVATSASFMYCGNGTTAGAACAVVTLNNCATTAGCLEANSGITVNPTSYTANGTFLKIAPPGILAVDSDAGGHPLTVALAAPNAPVPAGTLKLSVDANGGFTASIPSCTPAPPAATCPATFTYHAQNSQGTVSATTALVTINFAPATGLQVKVIDGTDKTTVLSDYRWVIEEDRTFYVDPNCTTNPPPLGCPTAGGIVPTFGTNFHSSYMPLIATGCTGTLSCEGGQTIFDPTTGNHIAAVCDQGNGVCRADPNAATPAAQGFTRSMPSSVHLDPTKRYYISVLPGDAANPFIDGNLSANCANGQATANTQGGTLRCGHGMGGAPVLCTKASPAAACAFAVTAASPVVVLTQPAPYPPAKLSVFVFEDDFPLNGEHDAAGGIDVLSPVEPGLGGFNITLFDDAGGTGDATGQMTYDMFNQPLTNSLAGTIDPATQLDACPVSTIARIGVGVDANGNPVPGTLDPTQTGITGTIVTCPKYESDGRTLSPLSGQAVVANLMIGRYGVVATPGADRIGRGEEWLQTNTLDGQKAHDSFLRVGEPSFFQEYGPAGYHVSIGFANPAIINARKPYICNGTDPNISGSNCTNTVTGQVTTERMSRTPDERLYSSGTYDSFSFTQCYVSFGDADGEDFAFTKCNPDGTFTLTGLPDGDWRVTVFDQWNDMLVDGLSTPVRLSAANNPKCPDKANSSAAVCAMGDIAMNQWQANIYTTTFVDSDGNGVRNKDANGNPTEAGLNLVVTNIRFRDGSYSNFNNTDLSGNAGFNEVFPLFSWYVIETDSTRYASTGTHVVYDAGGPADNSTKCGTAASPVEAPCGNSVIAANMANTAETVSVPVALRVPGAVYCADADCSTHPTGIKSFGSGGNNGTGDNPSACTISPSTGITSCTSTLSTGRIDPPWVTSEGWQGFSGQNSFIEFGKRPFGAGENGGIHGEVIYASTRPFDDPQLLLHTSWTPDVPGVTVRLYQVGTAADGTQSLTLVDTTTTSSWDAWAQGFYPNTSKPYMNCPGQLPAPAAGAAGDLFFFTLFNQPMFLDAYNNGGVPAHTVPNNSQFKCYDGMHNWNQVQPAPYDGMYQFPSIAGRDPTTGKPIGGTNANVAGTNCTVCVANPVTGEPMLPAAQYVVEMVVPPGYELVKEEDKNILIGDNYIAPVTQEFPGLGGSIYIMPDQANVASQYNANQGMGVSGFNATNAQNSTQALGRISSLPSYEGDTGSIEAFWPCVGQARIVPDFLSLFPQAQEVSPFAGAKRNLCDRKMVNLTEQSSVLAKFWIFTETHVAAHFTGVITDDFTSEFDPFSPQFGEKFSPANLPVAIKDWQGNEISRVYADQWGTYNGLTYSTWEVNPPNPTGYGPTMMVTCMNDPGSGTTPDPLYNPAYSDFCYEIPFMPGQTQYMDTPVVPTSAFAGAGYNNPDCDYPDTTPAVSEVDGDAVGPWLSATGARTLTINALGTVPVNNYAYTGPAAATAPYNQKTMSRKYSFGAPQGTGSVTLTNFAGNATVNLTVTSWTDSRITATVPATVSGNSWNCPIQQQTQYGGSTALCGQLVIKAGNGKSSVDAVTVTIGGKSPTHVTASGPKDNGCHAAGATYASVQRAIDCAAPGDMIIIDPKVRATTTTPATAARHEELVLMWKPVRLQGVGAGGSIIDANTHPAGKLDAWRRQVNCLFGLGISGQPMSAINPYDPSGIYKCPSTPANSGAATTAANFTGTQVQVRYWSGRITGNRFTAIEPQIDRLPLEAIVGWDASQNGNMAELLQEPSLMGALEGAGITVLSKGLWFPPGSDPYQTGPSAVEGGAFPDGTQLLSGVAGVAGGRGCNNAGTNPFTGNFLCNPSSIDGLTVQNSSQGGGGIFVHGWGHSLQIANNRVINNAGTLSGGINVGQGEFPGAYVAGSTTNSPPGSCQASFIPGTQLPYCFDRNVNMHHNMVAKNSSTGDELFSATPAGAGGVSICNGSDFYKFNYNWVCGNLSTGDGGGVAHIGFSYNGDIEHNSILFNQSTNPTIATNGGGLLIMGAPDVDPACGGQTDQDCLNAGTPAQPIAGPSDGVGPNLVINANLVMGNSADSGSGGGIRLQGVNGTDVLTFPTLPEIDVLGVPLLDFWYHVKITNNIIVNNVAGWDGAGISLQDALYVDVINNTIMSNDTTASSGVLFNTLGAPLASSQGPCPGGRAPDGSCPSANGPQTSTPQPAGLVSIQNSSNLTANLPTNIRCPVNHYSGASATNASCRTMSFPFITGDIFWENRAFTISVGGLANQSGLGAGGVNQQNVVTLMPSLSQSATDGTAANGTGRIITGGTGACVTEPTFSAATGGYWDIGVRGDTGPNNKGPISLSPFYSVLTNNNTTYGAAAQHNSTGNPNVISQYCNGARVPPENGGLGYDVPPGIADATVPNPVFNLTPAATVDEGNNWINMSWGPLSLINTSNGALNGTTLGNYGLTNSSAAAIGRTPSFGAGIFYSLAPSTDFYGNPRKVGGVAPSVDAGAVEYAP